MRSSRCVFSSATALHRVFIAPIELQSKLQVQIQVRQLSSTATFTTLRSQLQSQPQCSLSSTQKRHVSLHVAEKSRLPRDDEIKSFSVTLVSPEGKLLEPRSTSSILSSIDRKTESLVMIVPGSPGVPPICKILNKQAMRAAEKAKLKAARGTGVTQKTMELNWAIEKGDLGHRMGKLRGWLEKGWRVEVVIAGKKKGRKASEGEAGELMGTIRGVLGEAGGREMKPVEGKVLGTLTMFLEGKQQQGKKSKKGESDAAGAVVKGDGEQQVSESSSPVGREGDASTAAAP
ncbi:hypothetical protein BKA64DRAFT_737599 [Cadophora sp. MPI-SDFR-AT-0126]|nr:hypothetical protein BKA64DRAFT_737599 [Leotiomycetes sp. MPI-SDFR-AT-0126]